ncbi:uncharacterized protein LOC100909245 [Galendromus occidentalis]|uniref:Uncharacterized protein LOC100909245 n=1 Tax=Galendromus occidentalis TaxID=34638 RepID=A0AAJ7SEY3_9ACAR|nr:uncharacterized protein LOC100909245 [Galendromus occidentalis]
MPACTKQREVAVLRQPIRDSITKLKQELFDTIDYKDTMPDIEYERKLRVLLKQTQDATKNLEILDKAWIAARTKQLIKLQTKYYEQPKHEVFESTRHEAAPSVSQVLERLATVQETQACNLPKMELKKFYGNNVDFLSWWNEFKTYVHSLRCLTDLQKFKHLKDLLKGEAASCVEAIPVTDGNYVKAVNHVLRRYGNKERIVMSIFSKLLELPNTSKVIEIRKLKLNLDRVLNYMTTLESMSVEPVNHSTMIYPLYLQTLPETLIRQFVSSIPTNEPVDEETIRDPFDAAANELPDLFAGRLKSLLNFVAKEIETREQTGEITHSNEKKFDPLSNPSRSQNQIDQTGKNKTTNAQARDNKTPVEGKVKCVFCGAPHLASQCRSTGQLSVEQRTAKLKEAKLCTRCLRPGHMEDNCSVRMRCYECKGAHHKMLCPASSRIAVNFIGSGNSVLPTGHIDLQVGSRSIQARFLFDSAAERSWVTADLATRLNLKPSGFEFAYLYVFGGGNPKWEKCPLVSFNIRTLEGRNLDITALVIPTITDKELDLISPDIAEQMHQPAERSSGTKEISILFDAFDMMRLVKNIRHLCEGLAILQTEIGDVAIGGKRNASKVAVMVSAPASLEDFWKLEHFGILPQELQEQEKNCQAACEAFSKCFTKKKGMYETIINFDAKKVPLLSDNFSLARKQLESLTKTLSIKPDLKASYWQEMRSFLDNNFAEKNPRGSTPKYFMPHFPVVNETKTTYKVRPVFNASSHLKGQLSLNDCILDMPNLLPTSAEMLLKFRSHRFGLIGDIKKAYMTVGVQEEFRSYLCFLWYDSEDMKNPTTYRMTRNTFGVKDAQFNTIMAIREQAKRFEDPKPSGSKALVENLYMDDLIAGEDSIPKVHIIKDEDELVFDPDNLIQFVNSAKPCKRSIMGAAARLHDPIGLISPFVMGVKLLLQKIHVRKLTYDGILPKDLLTDWSKWCEQLAHLKEFSVPRYYAATMGNTLEIHAFADASEEAYAAVIYLKSIDSESGNAKTALVISKARMTPVQALKTLTIPRKELMAALLAARLMTTTMKALNFEARRFFWTDSMNVWHWIRGETPEKHGIFIKNRLTELLSLSAATEWFHVPGKLNPADLPSRGISMENLKSNKLWLNGPDFLTTGHYPRAEIPQTILTTITRIGVGENPVTETVIDVKRYSSLSRAIRVCATVLRAAARFKSNVGIIGRRQSSRLREKKKTELEKDLTAEPLSSAELSQARRRLLREAQSRCFREAIAADDPTESPRISKFAPFKDENGLLRVGGRLQNSCETFEVRHPVLLGSDELTDLIIRDIHVNQAGHLRTDCVLTLLRQEYWVLRARSVVKSVIRCCIVCKRYTAQPGGAEEAPLPQSRVESGGVFKNIGVDYLGPFQIKGAKVWICLFTCSVVRGLHLEVAENLSAEAFISCFKRFIAARGVPHRINSDNGCNFVRSAKAMKALWDNLREEQTQNFLGLREIEWSFNAPRAAWWGGQFERLIRTVKDCLRKTTNMHSIPLFDFLTVIKEIESIVNSRPLTNCPASVDDFPPLTPSHFLTPSMPIALPAGQVTGAGIRPDTLVHAWKRREALLNDFWKRWRTEYLLCLKSAHERRTNKTGETAVGDVVLIHEDNINRLHWRLGRVVEILKSRDGQIRTCKVKTAGGVIEVPDYYHHQYYQGTDITPVNHQEIGGSHHYQTVQHY